MDVVSKVIYYICSLLYIVQGILFYRILCCMAERRKGIFWGVVIYFSAVILSGMIIFPNDLFNVTLDLIWFSVLMLGAFHGSIWQKLAAASVLYPIIVSQNFLILDMLGRLDVLLGRSLFAENFCSLSDQLLHLLFWYMILRFFNQHLSQMKRLFDNRTWIFLNVICLASLVNITTCIYFSPRESYKMWPAALACLTTNLGSLFLAEYFTISIQKNMEHKNLKLQKSYYEELEKSQATIRKLRHDMNNHLSVIQSLYRLGNIEEAEHYLKKMEVQMAVQSRMFCKNSIINAVLNAKYNLAVEHKIDCFFHIDLQKLIGIDAVSLCCLFSNTLDNAIEASVKIPEPKDRYISAKARVTENGYFTYEIRNTKQNPVLEQKGHLQSDKENKVLHGLGLSNVREMVERYRGTLDISYTEDTFTVTVLIQDA